MNGKDGAGRNQVVARFKDGRLLKGYTHDFMPMKSSFHLTSERPGFVETVVEVKTEELKAIFFVKTLEGNKFYHEKKRFEQVDRARLRGLKIKVEFHDGEVMRGISLGYSKKKPGFFLIPIDPDSNNERVYVLTSSCRTITVGPAAEE
jgi:hypothetical protein